MSPPLSIAELFSGGKGPVCPVCKVRCQNTVDEHIRAFARLDLALSPEGGAHSRYCERKGMNPYLNLARVSGGAPPK